MFKEFIDEYRTYEPRRDFPTMAEADAELDKPLTFARRLKNLKVNVTDNGDIFSPFLCLVMTSTIPTIPSMAIDCVMKGDILGTVVFGVGFLPATVLQVGLAFWQFNRATSNQFAMDRLP